METQQIAEILAVQTSGNPFEYIGAWDMFAVILGVALRFIKSINQKMQELGDGFYLDKYFDLKHVIRWSSHIVVSVAAALFLPELAVTYIFPEYFEGLTGWTMFGSLLIGFIGYDFFKIGEKVASGFKKKVGLND